MHGSAGQGISRQGRASQNSMRQGKTEQNRVRQEMEGQSRSEQLSVIIQRSFAAHNDWSRSIEVEELKILII